MEFRVNAASERYLKRLAPRMEGWLDIYSARVIARLLEHQSASDLHGGLLEIGVHHGKLFLLMALNARPGEALLACDLFGMQEENVDRSGEGDRAVFLANAKRAGIDPSRITAMERNSLTVRPEEISQAAGGPIRFASIDGGHTAEITANDLRLVDATLDPRGAVALDDVFNQYWPDVAAGLFRYLAGPEARLVPFAISQNKTYLARKEMAEEYREHLARNCKPGLQRRKILLGNEVLVLHALTMFDRATDRPLALDLMLRGLRRRLGAMR